MSLALYRKYRSRSLSEVVGQDHVTDLLSRAIKQDKVAHAYLFTGPKGVGKTSIARILAHEINGLPYSDESTHLDIIEIDAASNNGVEDIRELRERVLTAPVSAAKKVYIIDEVHMLSKAAFNALLKTLEEPPEHVVFILATTDIDKVPETIISRTQRHSFRRASEPDIIKNLKRIAKLEKATVDDEVLALVAKHSDGSFRDSVSLFDQLLSGADKGTITIQQVTSSLGLVPLESVATLINATTAGDIAAINDQLTSLEAEGVPARTTTAQLVDHVRRNLATHPGYIRLLNDLLDVSRSHYPELKLLTVLSLYNTSAPVNAQLVALKVSAKAPAPSMPTARKMPENVPKPPSQKSPEEKPIESTPKVSKKLKPASGPFDWDALVKYVRTHHVAINSVFSKCEYELDGDTLRLYTKSAFYKKKLDDPKYKTLLSSSLQELGFDYEIEILSTAKPLKDSQAAKVAAIMGGGEEVSVNDA
jgi:DNA polymerase-3 subunit gamma/tau